VIIREDDPVARVCVAAARQSVYPMLLRELDRVVGIFLPDEESQPLH
jgi:hypothetical protein